MKTNAPYVKKYDENGIVTNPITKESPYLFPESLRMSKGNFRVWQKARNRFFTGSEIVKV